MIRRHFLGVAPASCWIATRSALAEPRAESDSRFPSSIASTIGGKTTRLALTGSALRKKYGFSVYSVASYLEEGTRIASAPALARADVAKQLHLIFERDVDGPSIASSFRGSIAANHPSPAFTAELDKLDRYFAAQGAKTGDHLWMTHIPGVGLGCQVVGQTGATIDGVPFARAVWDAYLGPNNIGVAIKDALTSRLR